MNRLIIDKNGKLEIKNSAIVFEDKRYPLRYIDFLILSGNIEITTKTLSKLTKEGVTILIYNRGFSIIYSVFSKNGEIKKFQYETLSKRLEIAKVIISEKIKRGCEFLGFSFDFERFDEIESIEGLLGVEGAFAREYFKKYFSLFPKHLTKRYRSKRPPKDVVNGFMSFLYTLLYYEITNRLIMQGFEPQIGYLHEPFREHNALSSDILELFRSDVDKFVLNQFLSGNLKKEDFDGRFYLRNEKRKELWKEVKEFLESLKIEEGILKIKKLIKNDS